MSGYVSLGAVLKSYAAGGLNPLSELQPQSLFDRVFPVKQQSSCGSCFVTSVRQRNQFDWTKTHRPGLPMPHVAQEPALRSGPSDLKPKATASRVAVATRCHFGHDAPRGEGCALAPFRMQFRDCHSDPNCNLTHKSVLDCFGTNEKSLEPKGIKLQVQSTSYWNKLECPGIISNGRPLRHGPDQRNPKASRKIQTLQHPTAIFALFAVRVDLI
jgi:hypothetical protein